MLSAVLVAIVYVPMVLEANRAASNERTQRSRGGVEAPGDVYSIMRVVYPATFLAMIVEQALRGGSSPGAIAVGVGLFIAAKAVKWWAISTLGPAWTFRVIVIPGAERVTGGPYRFVRHPNYIAVVAELIAVGVMTGAWVSAPIAVLGFGLLILKRVAVEERALRSTRPS